MSVANKCLTTNVVYKATVKYEEKTQHYIGMTKNSFKSRYTLHKSSIKHSNPANKWSYPIANIGASLIGPGLTGLGNAPVTFECRKNSTFSLEQTLSTRRLSCSISVPTAENSWRETASHSFPRSTLTPVLTLVNTVLCVCVFKREF